LAFGTWRRITVVRWLPAAAFNKARFPVIFIISPLLQVGTEESRRFGLSV
jgi:hypothetical protein